MFSRGRIIPLVAALAVSVAACDDDDNGGTNVQDPPAQPTGVSVTQSGDALVVGWTAVTGADSYDVQRRDVGGSTFAAIASDVSGTEYTDDTAAKGVSYLYRVIAKNANGSSTPSDPADGLIDPDTETLSGEITTDVTLDANISYTIAGVVTVEEGASLTIPAGTLLMGSVDIQPSALMVRTGGQIFSNGTETDPVVFTSSAPKGSRQRGDWGGVVINGLSICNFPAEECIGEGASGPYGGGQLDDDSGSMTYTRIEFAGFEVSFGNELNALTLNGVGSGTTLEHIQTHYGSDDGFEFFGGTVDLKWAIATGISDDSFDYSTGWQGRGQFWIAQQDPDDADNGFEVDGNEDDFDAMPLTDPTIYNITLVGKGENGAGGTAGESVDGLRLRRGTGGDIVNAIVVGFGGAGVDVDNVETVGRYSVQNSIIALNVADIKAADDGPNDPPTDSYQAAVDTTAAWNNMVGTDPILVDAFNRAAPDFRPDTGSPALASAGNGATPPSDGFFDIAATYVGAVDPEAATQWFEGWITLAQN